MEATESFYKRIIHKSINSAKCVNDLIPMLHSIPFNNIKDFVNQQVNELNLYSCRHLYYTQTSIDDIFPEDIMQYILSFGGLYHTKTVNTKWKQYGEKNEQIHFKKIYKSISQIQIASPIKYNENTNKTYIIDKYREKLNKIEIELGYMGPINDIEKAVGYCKSGDSLLIHNGVFDVSYVESEHRNIQFIGVGNDVTIKDMNKNDPFFDIGNDLTATKCYFNNIKFEGSRFSNVISLTNASLSMENCALKLSNDSVGIGTFYGSSLNVNNCTFTCISETVAAIMLSPNAKEVNIIGCHFKNCGVVIDDTYDHLYGLNNTGDVRLKCVGNVFDISIHLLDDFLPLTEKHVSDDNNSVRNAARFILNNNSLKGYDATKMTSKSDKIDPNKIYI